MSGCRQVDGRSVLTAIGVAVWIPIRQGGTRHLEIRDLLLRAGFGLSHMALSKLESPSGDKQRDLGGGLKKVSSPPYMRLFWRPSLVSVTVTLNTSGGQVLLHYFTDSRVCSECH